ncbi:MAG: DUF5693 family protein [bacterium]|nr:DUF5693 family protein [bacterium]
MTRGLRLACYALLALGLAVAVYSASLRIAADAMSRKVMVLVDWRELNQLLDVVFSDHYVGSDDGRHVAALNFGAYHFISDRSIHKAPWELLEKLPGACIAYGEETIGDLLQQGIISPADVSTSGPTYEVGDLDYVEDIARGASRHGYITERRKDGRLLIQLPPPGPDGVNSLPLAWRSDVIATIRSHDILCILRPAGTELFSADGLDETLDFANDQPLMLFQGTQVPGFPHNLKRVANQLKEQKQLFSWVEFDDQDGGAQLASQTAPYVARVHSITAEEMEKYDIARAVERYELALTERGIRVLFVRPFVRPGLNKAKGDYREQVREVNSKYFAALGKMVKAQGYTIGRPRPFSDPPKWLVSVRKVAITLAVTAGALLLLSLFVPLVTTRWVVGLLALGQLAAVGSIAVSSIYSIVLLVTGIVFPLLGFWTALLVFRRRVAENTGAAPSLGWALLCLLIASVISAAGGILIHGGMWSARALLHIDQYRGVTIALAFPVLLVAAYCWQAESLADAWDGARGEIASFWQRFTTLWISPIRYGDVAVILLAVGAIGLVLLRSGNEGPIGVIGAEGSLRDLLENALAVRPRTKELLGHPLLVLFLLSLTWRTRAGLLFALAGILAQVSVLNTFLHLHTPLLITLQRVGVGLLIGVITGAVLGAVALLITRYLKAPPLQRAGFRTDATSAE